MSYIENNLIQIANKFQCDTDIIYLISTNIDDMPSEYFETIFEKLLANGAIDVFISNLIMKKSRGGFELKVMCKPNDFENIIELIFNYTTTLGLRIEQIPRIILKREIVKHKLDDNFEILIKISYFKNKILNIKPEFESLKKYSQAKNISIYEAYHYVINSFKLSINNLN